MSDRNQTPDLDIRDASVPVRLSPAEREQLRLAAERRGWPLSTFIRRAALKAAQQRRAA